MAKVPYAIYKNESAGRPTLYLRCQHHQTLGFDDLCRHVSHVVHLEPAILRGIIETTLNEAYRHCLRGFRVELGDRKLSLYPQVRKSMPAEVDEETGEILWPDTEDFIPQGDDGRLECEVHKRWNQHFRSDVHWERIRYEDPNRKGRKR